MDDLFAAARLTCSAEDLVIMKAFAARSRDWSDVETIIKRQRALDWSYVMQTLEPLAELKEDVPIVQTLENLRRL